MADVKTAFEQLKAEWNEHKKDLTKIENLLDILKMKLAASPSFLPTADGAQKDELLLIQRKMLEIYALTMCMKRDMERFPVAMDQLMHYYHSVKPMDGNLGQSEMQQEMIGLYLLYLLAQNKLIEFHTELERIPWKLREENIYISKPVKLEQYLSVGLYNRIFDLKEELPSPYYHYFMNILLDTVKDEIAGCLEKSCTKLSVKKAARLLNFTGSNAEQEILAYGKTKKWIHDKGHFRFLVEKNREFDQISSAVDTTLQLIDYAKQLERIV